MRHDRFPITSLFDHIDDYLGSGRDAALRIIWGGELGIQFYQDGRLIASSLARRANYEREKGNPITHFRSFGYHMLKALYEYGKPLNAVEIGERAAGRMGDSQAAFILMHSLTDVGMMEDGVSAEPILRITRRPKLQDLNVSHSHYSPYEIASLDGLTVCLTKGNEMSREARKAVRPVNSTVRRIERVSGMPLL